MAIFDLRGIVCDKTQEAVDEPYLRIFVDGDEERWGPVSMDDGESRSISFLRSFREGVRVTLWEDDSRRDDYIGDLSVAPTDVLGGERTHRIVGRGAEYRLIYAVNPPRDEEFALILDSLRCNDAQERTDEPYLVVNGDTVWGPSSMRTGQTRDIEIGEAPYFTRNAIVELWEKDRTRSDKIGTLEIGERLARTYAEDPTETHSHVFRRDSGIVGDARYTLTYRIRLVPIPVGPPP